MELVRAPAVSETPPVLSPSLLVAAYRSGYFPMAMEGGEIGWFSPDPRGILPLAAFHAPRRLQRVLRSARFSVTVDTAFRGVMEACAADRDEGTWISAEIVDAYCALHAAGAAHAVEVWRDERLVGGLYGVSLGAVFFGESMFHRERDASKVALAFLVARLKDRGYEMLDIQWTTPFLETFGAVEIPKELYLLRLERALRRSCRFDDR